MLNKVVFEGLVTNAWRFGSDLFVRLASYRDPFYPVKRSGSESRDEPDYVNVRFTNGAQQNLNFVPGTVLRVEGLLQSREYNESLAEFMDKARKLTDGSLGIELVGKNARHILCGRSTVEIVVQEYVVVQLPREREERPAPRKPVLASKPAVQEKKEKAPAAAEAATVDAPVAA